MHVKNLGFYASRGQRPDFPDCRNEDGGLEAQPPQKHLGVGGCKLVIRGSASWEGGVGNQYVKQEHRITSIINSYDIY